MGVPGFFAWFLKKKKGKYFIFNSLDVNEIEALMLDSNCFLHPMCFKVLAEYPKLSNKYILEEKMIDACIEYLNKLISVVNPTKLIYIAIDGVAPIAKIKQQRSRRFKSVKDKRLYNNIKKKHNQELDNNWSNSAITPGTDFMKKLTTRIIKFCEEYNFEGQIIFSSADTPGEGEHKLLQYIRNNDNNFKYVIYGLDADLIFLGLSINRPHIYLLREVQVKGQTNFDKYNYISIDGIKQCIMDEINDLLMSDSIDRNLDRESVIRDFIFICYFLGNDFLPHIPSIDIRCFNKEIENGLDLLLQAYAYTYDNINEYLIIDSKYNVSFLIMFLEYLASFENEFFGKLYEMEKKSYFCKSKSAYEKEKHKIDNLQFKIINDINLGMDTPEEWKFRYYKKYYHEDINQREFIKQACNIYFEGLVWVANYYFNQCISWSWYYPYDHAPFISDMIEFIKKFQFDKVEFSEDGPIKPVEQLLCVLPPQSAYLVPNKYQWLMKSNKSPLSYLYPYDFELDMLYKTQYWQCIPDLPPLDVKHVIKQLKKNGLKKKETIEPFIF